MTNLCGIIALLRLESTAALKDKDTKKRAIINTVISDLLIDGKEPSPEVGLEKAFSVLKQYRKNLDKGGDMQPYINILLPLLPKQLTLEELSEIVKEQGLSNMKAAMVWFKTTDFLFEPSVLKEVFNVSKQ